MVHAEAAGDVGDDRALRVTVLAGGYGGSKLSHGFALLDARHQATGSRPIALSVVVNTGDDLELHGLRISPDIDTVMYTLSGWANTTTGWGVRDDTWINAEMLARYGAPTWFRLGDRDLATNLLRTEALRAGSTLTEVTGRLASALGVRARILPMTDTPVATRLRTAAGWLAFQEYFVQRHHADDVLEVRFDGIEDARATDAVVDALTSADLIVIAPSNPLVSVDPILAVSGIRSAIGAARAGVIAVSPIVGGSALRGPADRMLTTLGGEASAAGVARHYAEHHPGLVRSLVIDTVDSDHAPAVEATGIRAIVTDTVMTDDAGRERLAAAVLAAAGPTPG